MFQHKDIQTYKDRQKEKYNLSFRDVLETAYERLCIQYDLNQDATIYKHIKVIANKMTVDVIKRDEQND